MMGEDEQKAIRLLDKNLSIQKPLIEQHQGKLLKEIGDGLLCSFNKYVFLIPQAPKPLNPQGLAKIPKHYYF